MLLRVRGQLTSMTNHKINQRLKAFCHRRTRIRWALIQRKEPGLARVVTRRDGRCLFNGELTYTLCRHCISWKCWNITLQIRIEQTFSVYGSSSVGCRTSLRWLTMTIFCWSHVSGLKCGLKLSKKGHWLMHQHHFLSISSFYINSKMCLKSCRRLTTFY